MIDQLTTDSSLGFHRRGAHVTQACCRLLYRSVCADDWHLRACSSADRSWCGVSARFIPVFPSLPSSRSPAFALPSPPACCADLAARIRTRHAPASCTLQRHAVAGVVRASCAFHTGLSIIGFIIAARRRLRCPHRQPAVQILLRAFERATRLHPAPCRGTQSPAWCALHARFIPAFSSLASSPLAVVCAASPPHSPPSPPPLSACHVLEGRARSKRIK